MIMDENERICSACGKPMKKGYCIEGGATNSQTFAPKKN